MTLERIQACPHMSQAVVHSNTFYTAGQVAQGKTITEQTKTF